MGHSTAGVASLLLSSLLATKGETLREQAIRAP